MLTSLAYAAAGAILLVLSLRTHAQLRTALARMRQPPPRLARYPSVTVIRPIRGIDVEARDNLAAAFATGYPGAVETLFVLDDASDPALPLVHEAIATARRAGHREPARVLFAGSPPPGRTGKLNAMIAGLAAAHGELVAFADSDTRPGPGALRVLVETLLSDPRAGSAFAPVYVPGPRFTAGDVGYALMLNALYGPSASLAAAGNGGALPFIMGQYMIFRREALHAIGGLESASGQLVDDMHLGGEVARAGYKNLMTSCPVPIIEHGMGLGEFARTYRRWIIFSRSGLPSWSFKWPAWVRGLEFWGATLLTLLAIATGHGVGALVPLAAAVVSSLSLVDLHEAAGGRRLAPRHVWVPAAMLLTVPLVYVSTLLHRGVRWRGRTYALDQKARLEARPGRGAAPSRTPLSGEPARP
jgi:ceramide glucosyltransferase